MKVKLIQLIVLSFLSVIPFIGIIAQSSSINKVDVLSYHVFLEPNLTEQSIEGSVLIKFNASTTSDKVIFDSGNLIVTKLEGKHTSGFEQKGNKTIISLTPRNIEIQEIKLFYHGKPKKGLIFQKIPQQVYSLYFTNEWMICNASPDDKATLKIDLLVSEKLTTVASGVLKDTSRLDDKIRYSWNQDYETPAYTYGFTIGSFNKYEYNHNGKHLKYYGANYTAKELETIFQYTGDMMAFFEEKSGICFPQNSYSQVLVGSHYQEMSGFAVLKKSYGNLILKDSTETNLISHELAHQWWGNRITCKNWNHFWLNEGFATFMSAAYNEHRFGQEKYKKDIDSYFKVYDKIKSKGKDKPLVFDNWKNPSADDRNLVYFKGAYVLHLLRKELGEASFWNGILYFSQTYYGKSVTTKNFQIAMEKASNQTLESFFNKWIY